MLDEARPEVVLSYYQCPDSLLHRFWIFSESVDEIKERLETHGIPSAQAAELKKRFGDNIVFCGAIDTDKVLPLGSVDDVRQEVRRVMSILGPGGGCMIGAERCVPWATGGQLIATVGSQLAIAGALLLWVANQKMTWARAGFAALLTWIEFVIIFGIVPSEWLNLSQGPLEMTRQRIAFTIPEWLVLGNEVSISWAAVKDAISGTYNLVVLGAAIYFAYRLQGWGKDKPKAAEVEESSVYGRPLIKGSR